ncbi:MAG: hypothetical protein M0R80_26505 [Proteobacteria bacterium]|jgi:hypothetical protein|nr:hypothetical protein [Pseudomonadota bacterium]
MEQRESGFRTGEWVRFGGYEIINGCICPTVSTQQESYDPWKGHRPTEAGEPVLSQRAMPYRDSRPYFSLFDLVEKIQALEAGAKRKDALRKNTEKLIIDWCCHHGLLGVLLHELVFVQLGLDRGETGGNGVFCHSREGGRSWGVQKLDMSEAVIPFAVVEKVSRTPQDLRGWRMERPGKNLQKPHGPPSEWERYFPRMNAFDAWSNSRFTLASEPFWNEYGEPVERFLDAAFLLKTTVEALFEHRSRSSEKWKAKLERKAKRDKARPVEYDDPDDFDQRMKAMDYLVSRVSTTFELAADGTYNMRWHTTSLLGTFAMMALIDLTQKEGDLARCSKCERFFWQSSDRAVYCTLRCKRAANMRVYRAKAAQAHSGEDE